MSLYSQFGTDKKVEQEGVFLQYGTTKDGKPIQIKICRAGGANTAYNRAMEAKTKPYRRQLQNGTLDMEVMTSILREVYADTVVIGWSNIEDADGKPMPFNRDNVIKLFTDLPELFADVQEQATNLALFRVEINEQDAKN